MFEHLHPKINCAFWMEFREAFKELRLSFDIMHERVDTLSGYTMKVHYIGVPRNEMPFAFDKAGSGALLVLDVKDALAQQQQSATVSPRGNSSTGLQTKPSMLNLTGK